MSNQQPNQPQWGRQPQAGQQWGGSPGQVPQGGYSQGLPQGGSPGLTPPRNQQSQPGQQRPGQGPQAPQAGQQWGGPPGQVGFSGPSMPGGMPPSGPVRKSNKNAVTFGVIGLVTLLIIGVIGWAIFGRGGDKDPLPTPSSSSSSSSADPSRGPSKDPSSDPSRSPSKGPSSSPSPTSPSKPPTGSQKVELWEGITATLPSGWTVEKRYDSKQAVVVLNEDKSAKMTLQAAEGQSGDDAVSLMGAYLKEQGAQIQNPTYMDVEEITTTSTGNAAVGGVSGVYASGSGSSKIILVSLIGVRRSDSVFVLCTLMLDAGDPRGEALVEDWAQTSQSMVDSLLG